MSSPNTAPTDDAAVETPVGDEAPEVEGEVGSESTHVPDGYIEKNRFDGLMGRFHREQAEKQRLEQELREARERLESLHAQANTSEETPVADEALAQEVAALKQMLMEERLESRRANVLEKYPEAKPFADLIVGDTPEDFEAMAREVAERVRSATGGPAPTAEAPSDTATDVTPPSDAAPEAPAAPAAPPVTGGAAAFDGGSAVQDRVRQAIDARDFGAYLRAKAEGLASGDVQPLA